MAAGVAAYFAYVSIPIFDSTHQFVNNAISIVQPALVFCMLFVSFCRVRVQALKPHWWMAKMLAIQIGSFVAMALPIIFLPDIPGRVIIEAAMLCMICPTATAAAVVTTKLNGNANVVVSYTCLINIAVSITVPAIVPLMHVVSNDLTFLSSFSLIMAKVFPLLVVPLAAASFTRHFLPKLHSAILKRKDLAFHLWAIALALAIGVTVKAIVHSNESIWELVGIAVASLIACVVQFICGHIIGKRHGETIAGTQGLGQKNTVFAIWMGYTFMNPVTAMAGGFYSVWHNFINSYQLWREQKAD